MPCRCAAGSGCSGSRGRPGAARSARSARRRRRSRRGRGGRSWFVRLPRVSRVALVTGAASGIGRATARALGEAGFDVVGADVQGGDGIVELDVTDAAGAARLAADVGPVWAVVNCAGWDETKQFLETDEGFWQRVLAINLLGVVADTHAFLGGMVEAGDG